MSQNNVNYQKVLDKTIEDVCKKNIVPSLLIHSCCAPCSSYTLEYLSKYFKITVLYYNPNIFPKEEYEYRIKEQDRLIKSMDFDNPVEFMTTDYTPEDFYSQVKGLENEKEGGRRCEVCFRLRLEKTAKIAQEKGFDYFVTTLSISPMKNSALLNEIGKELEEQYKVKYLLSDFKKRNGYKRSVELSKLYDLYRQDYCGCVYSKVERDNQVKELGCK